MNDNPLRTLGSLGQSVWMDFIRRDSLLSGELRRYIEEDDLRGVTSNPSIFEKAITGSDDYDAAIRRLALAGRNPVEIYEALAIEDIQRAADLFRPVFDRLSGADGFVSLEVSPDLAHDTDGTIAEARRLWTAVDRPNVMIKVPATRAGLPAIAALINEGIHINVTLLFGLERYREVVSAWLAGLEARSIRAEHLRVASVASFFLSRIDVVVDAELDRKYGADPVVPSGLRGQVAIASARIAYERYGELVESDRFRALATKGARPQRLLWASTSTKDPAYSDVKYVEALIGRDTIDTVPLETFTAYRDHGDPAPRLAGHADEARAILADLGGAGIDLDVVTQRLEDEGVAKFSEARHRLLDVLADRRAAIVGRPGAQRRSEDPATNTS